MSEEIDIVSRVGGAILLAETEWTPKAGVSKERAMALAAIEAMREPTQGMRHAVWERLEKSAAVGNLRAGHIRGDGHPDVLMSDILDAALMAKALEGKK